MMSAKCNKGSKSSLILNFRVSVTWAGCLFQRGTAIKTKSFFVFLSGKCRKDAIQLQQQEKFSTLPIERCAYNYRARADFPALRTRRLCSLFFLSCAASLLGSNSAKRQFPKAVNNRPPYVFLFSKVNLKATPLTLFYVFLPVFRPPKFNIPFT